MLKSKVDKWLSEGLISHKQKEDILNYEKTSKGGSWILYGFLIVAVFSASLGVIALIAANWRAIPPFVKLISYFMVLGAVGQLALKQKPKAMFELLLIFFMILCLAGIGLISQIYNIEGESYKALFFWSVITAGLMACSRTELSMYLWLGGLYMACIGWLTSMDNDSLFFKTLLLHPLLFFSLAMLLYNKKIRQTFPLLTIKRKTIEEWAVFTGFISLIGLHFVPSNLKTAFFEPAILLFISLLVFTSVFLSAYKKIQKHLLTGILLLFFLFYFLAFSTKLNSLVLMIFSSLMLALCAFFFATLKKQKLFMLFITAMILRILFFYINLFKSLAFTGFILVLMSFIIVVGVQVLKKNKAKLRCWMEQWE